MKGFSLIEVIVTIAIVGILASISGPSFSQMMRTNEVSSLSIEFVSALRLAQSESIRRGTRITVAPYTSSSGEWKSGWDIFEDTANYGIKNTGEEIIKTFEKRKDKLTLTSAGSVFSTYITFIPNGTVQGNSGFNGSFRLCPTNSDIKIAQNIEIERSGNVTSSKTTTVCP